MNHYIKVLKNETVIYIMHIKSNIDYLLSIIDALIEEKYQYESICETIYTILKDKLKIKHYVVESNC
jgi:hypothetical protein